MARYRLQRVLEEHTEVISEFKDRLAEAQRPDGVASDAIVRDKMRLLEAIEERLETARQVREATVARLDARIETLEERVGRLRDEIEKDEQAIERRRKKDEPLRRDVPGVDAPKPSRPPGKGRKGPPVTDIKGIGDTYRERLEAHGIRTPAEVARMKPGALAEALSISEDRARAIVDAAKKLKK